MSLSMAWWRHVLILPAFIFSAQTRSCPPRRCFFTSWPVCCSSCWCSCQVQLLHSLDFSEYLLNIASTAYHRASICLNLALKTHSLPSPLSEHSGENAYKWEFWRTVSSECSIPEKHIYLARFTACLFTSFQILSEPTWFKNIYYFKKN